MASRTSTGLATGITIAVLAVPTITLFVLSLVFYGQKQDVTRRLDEVESSLEDYVKTTERNSDRVLNLIDSARGERQSLVSYLIQNNRSLAGLAVGNENLLAVPARERAQERTSLGGSSLLGRIELLESQISQLERERDDFKAQAAAAAQDLQSEIDRLAAYEQEIESSISAANQRVQGYSQDVDDFRTGVDRLETRLTQDRETERLEFSQQIRDLQARIAELTQENLVLADINRTLRGESQGASISPRDEFALVDGEVVSIDPITGDAIISLGRGDKVSIGLTFSVYGDVSGLRVDPATGEYREGKAVLEVTRINDRNARARVIRESRLNPVVAGDIIANPLYDPSKVYTFVVYGEFDTNRDGNPTDRERARVEALINQWGGRVVDAIQGDVDFVVLGERPQLPPQPAAGAPREILELYLRNERSVRRYDELFSRAADTSIPVLSFNRFMTLIGEVPN
ncbi:MAG: hypothetical protein AAF235_03565 [Planctomycetota bacterium]